MASSLVVYEDFVNYKSGIYERVSDERVGSAKVQIIGYGEENGIQYWICANSWGKSWGEEGFFRIKVKEADIGFRAYGC